MRLSKVRTNWGYTLIYVSVVSRHAVSIKTCVARYWFTGHNIFRLDYHGKFFYC